MLAAGGEGATPGRSLPSAATPLLGRERELGQLARLLRLLELLDVLSFASTNTTHRPVLAAVALLRRYAGPRAVLRPRRAGAGRPPGPEAWREPLYRTDGQGRERIVRTVYEVCVFAALRDRLRCTGNALSTHRHRTPTTYVNALPDARLHPGTYRRADRRRQASRDAAHLWDTSGVVERTPEPSFWTFS